jgi:deoxyribodipyrimidine photolyase-related protein
MVTKPYVSGSAYVNKMSDYCKGCDFDPKKSCPMTSLYWNFLRRNESVLEANPRLRIVMSALRKRDIERIGQDQQVSERVTEILARGDTLTPHALVEFSGGRT